MKKLSNDDIKNLRWGSHIPCNTSILKTFPINGVLEIGAGLNSTPLFFNNCKTVISIENDLNWINHLKNNNLITETDNHKIVYHELPNYINRSTLRKDVSIEILDNAIDFYKSFLHKNLNLLFIDGYASLRLEALVKLHSYFDIIVYHDTEPRYDHCYDYSKFTPNLDYIQIFDKTFPANVGILINSKFEKLFPIFKKTFETEAYNYAKKFNTTCTVILEIQ